MNYSTLCEIVGPINRGQLDCGFKADVELESTVSKRREPTPRTKTSRPPLTEDLSRFAKHVKLTKAQIMAKIPRCNPNTREFYQLLYGRDKTLAQIAGEAGVSTSVAHRCINGSVVRQRVKSALMESMTKAEIKSLGWTP